MNTQTPQPPQDAASRGLPALSDVKVDEIEEALFAEITRDRVRSSTRRRRVWLGAGAAAAVIVVAAVIAPFVAASVTPSASTEAAGAPAVSSPIDGSEIAKDADSAASGVEPLAGSGAAVSQGSVDRQIIATASATVVVDDIASGARSVAAAATGMGGYVESMTIGQSGIVYPTGGAAHDVAPLVDSMPVSPTPDSGWVTVRVPSDQLAALIDQLGGIGEVTASAITRQDVTDETIDLQARIDAAQASVDRLTELMAQAATTADLIAAESALAERQATLESYQQQLEYLSDQVDLSTLTVSLTPKSIPVDANPAGFADGLAAGWNGLIATLNALVVAIGFLIPWIVVILVIAAVVWAIVTIVRRTRARRRALARTQSAPDEATATSGAASPPDA